MSKQFTNLDFQSVAKVTGLIDPTLATDAVNLQYLQAFVRGLVWKTPVRAASTANVSLTAPGATLDGVTLATNDRILLKNQTTTTDNGIYVWTGASTPLTRATDANTGALLSGATVTSLEGTTNGDKVWTQTADAITIGTTPISWAAVGGSGASYTAGNGLTLTGSAFAVVVGNGLIVDGSGVRVDPAVVSRKFAKDNAAGSTEVVTHNLGTKDVDVTFRLLSTDEKVDADWIATSTNTITVIYANSQTAATVRIVVQG